MSKLITSYQDLQREAQENRCRAALMEIRNGGVNIPLEVIYGLDGPVLMQLAHMVVFLEQDWRDSLRWIWDHRGEVLEHGKNADAAKRHELETEYAEFKKDVEDSSPPKKTD